MLKPEFDRFKGDTYYRYIHYDGSSAYAYGWMRLFESTNIRVSLGVALAYAVVSAAIKPEGMPALSILKNTICVVAGAGLFSVGAVELNSLWNKTVGKVPGVPRFFSDRNKIYDVTGQSLSKHHLEEVKDAKALFTMEAFMSPMAAGIVTLLAVSAGGKDATPLSFVMAGLMCGVLGSYTTLLRRSWQIANEKITLVDNLPPREEKKQVPAPKRAFQPS